MILLLGGTSESAPLAEGLAKAGYRVLVSCATDIDLNTGHNPGITKRTGPLDTEGLATLIQSSEITLLVDATHPYATQARISAREAAKQSGIPYLTFIRPEQRYGREGIIEARDHGEAARLAFTFNKPVLLTTGARNLAPYVAESRVAGTPLIVRVLSEVSSIEACRAQGIPENHIIARRGPFSVLENREQIRRFSVGVLVTKDSGQAGGVAEKIEAARFEGCRIVVIKRPTEPSANSFESVEALLKYVAMLQPV